MLDFEVWAPRAGDVAVVVGGVRTPMQRRERGWWHARVEGAGPGSRYGYSLDGGDPLPDPRSRSQPDGVHGLSQVVDSAAFSWTDSSWRGFLPKGPIYEMHVGTFTGEGTFDAAVARLDHLAGLGVEAVEVMPVAAYPGERGWGYDGVDLFSVHETYGGADSFKRFVDSCHARGMCVILDVVYNHLGPDGNYLASYGPYFSDTCRTPWGEGVNFDGPGSSEVRDFVIDNALMWFEDYHVDGLRLDAVHAIHDQSPVNILEELQIQVEMLKERLDRTLFLVAEDDLNNPRIVTPRMDGGFGLHARWCDDFHHSLHALLTGERVGYYADFGSIAHLAKSMERMFVYDGGYSAFRQRRQGRPIGDLPGLRFVGYLQSHDQIGNRSQGERSGHLMSFELLKVGAALVLAAPLVPMLFQGEEWGATSPFCYFTDHDRALGDAIAKGRRREVVAFGWEPDDVPDPQSRETFEMSKLDWTELNEPLHSHLLDWHRELIALRHSTRALNDGRLDDVHTDYDPADRWLTVRRGPVTVVANFSERIATVPLGAERSRTLLLTSAEPPDVAADEVALGPESVSIFTTESNS